MARELPCFQVDAFTARAFAGNPAAVCPLDAWLPDATMQAIAMENALSETAFFVREGDDFALRWFTPELEVELCGHATLASAYVLMTLLEPSRTHVRFRTMTAGALEVSRVGSEFVLDFPSRPPSSIEPHPAIGKALGGRVLEWHRARDVVAVYGSAEEVRALRPDFGAIAAVPEIYAVIATAPGSGKDVDVDFVSRFFAPAKGVPEDPVTGSAHCTLAPFWGARTKKPITRGRQVSQRGGEVRCEVKGERVLLAGQAVLVKKGTLLLPE